MKAAVFQGDCRFAINEVTTPKPGPGEVLCKVKFCGICGTDLHNCVFNIAAPGVILGHEWCGEVVELGSDVSGYTRGDRVMPFKYPNSPQPALRINARATYSNPSRRPGAYAEYVVAEASRLMLVPDDVTDEEASCIEPLVAAIHAVRLGNPKLSDQVAFIGAGPIGLMMVQRVRQAGVRGIYVSEPSPTRRSKALQLGADRVFDPFKDDVIAQIVELTGGKGPDIVYECAAARNTLDQACQLVARNGRVTCLAVYQEPITLNPLDWYQMQPEIKFTTNGDSTAYDWEIALELLRRHQIDIKTLVSDIIPLPAISEAFQALNNPAANSMLHVLVAP